MFADRMLSLQKITFPRKIYFPVLKFFKDVAKHFVGCDFSSSDFSPEPVYLEEDIYSILFSLYSKFYVVFK